MNIIDFIPFGKDNAISRRALCLVTELPDRLMRREIERARKDYAILNIDGSGYFRPAEDETYLIERWLRPAADEAYLIERWLRQERSRENSVRNATRGAEKALLGGSRELIHVDGYVRRKRRVASEKPQVEGQIKL